MLKSAIALMLVTPWAMANSPTKYITLGSDVIEHSHGINALSEQNVLAKSDDGISMMALTDQDLAGLSELMHHDFHRCGGYIVHDSEEEALEEIRNPQNRHEAVYGTFSRYSINQERTVNDLIQKPQAKNIEATISKLTSYRSRYYKSQTGVESSKWIKDHWQSLVNHRTDSRVELYNHSRYPQASIVLTITGSKYPNDIVVLGGHADSILSSWWGGGDGRAPGADDNASGIASITETIRVLMEGNFRPERTIQFMGYAAEEVGLLGSNDIAKQYKAQGKNVIGVMQLDMTGFKGDRDYDITFIDDHTNKAQNEYLAKLVDTYLKYPWHYSRCGYGCSDHASWTKNGYPASFPHESAFNNSNKKIHTTSDTLATLGGNANHARKFTQLAIAYLVEMAKAN